MAQQYAGAMSDVVAPTSKGYQLKRLFEFSPRTTSRPVWEKDLLRAWGD